MPTLPNPRQERFAQAVASGMSAAKAYVEAGYKPHGANPLRLSRNERVAARVSEIVSAAADRTEITIERALREMGKIGFADIRGVVKWRRQVVQTNGGDDCPEQFACHLVLVDSDDIPNDVAAAIAEVSQTKDGTIRVRMHNKQAALESILRQLEKAKGVNRAVEEKTQPTSAGSGIIDAREAFKRFGMRQDSHRQARQPSGGS